MIFYTATDENGRQHLAGTQADARAIDRDFVQIDIPTDKAGLMAYAQGLLTQIDDLRLMGEPDGSGAAEEGSTPSLPQPDPTPALTPAPAPVALDAIAISEAIQDLEGRDLGRVLSSAIQQLGSLRMSGVELLRVRDPLFATDVRSRTALERGFGYLVLDGLAGPLTDAEVPRQRSWATQDA